MEAPTIKPYKTKEFDSRQSQYQHADKLPMRAIVLGPSGSGKTILLQNMILDVYRGAFARIYIFSPSIDVDYSWSPVKDYIDKVMKVRETKEEPIYFNSYDPQALEQIVSTQHKVAEYMKKQDDKKKIYQILIVIDDFADDARFTRHDKLLQSLYTRGRHNFISTITSTQVFTMLSPIIRKNATALYIHRLRNYRDLESLIEELSAIYPKKTLMELYEVATGEPHSFWYINLMAKNKKDMFYMNYDRKLEVED